MPGQCYKCGSEFSVFKKEKGCKNCGFAFCNKCLNEKSIPIPKRNNEKHHVCHGCYQILTGTATATPEQLKYDLPEAYIKRMAALQQREGLSHGSSNNSSKSVGTQKIPESLRKLDKADREIALRLEKLREDDKTKEPVTDAQLQARLAQLKGQPAPTAAKPVYHPPDRRPETQQVDDLLEQLTEEVALDLLMPDPAQEAEERLCKFREDDAKKLSKTNADDVNLDQEGVSGKCVNNLNVVGKVESKVKPYSKNITGASTLEEKTLDEIHKIIVESAAEVETDARKALESLTKDQELMDRLKVLQTKRDANRQADDVASVNSDTDNTNKNIDAAKLEDSDEDSDDEDVAAAKLVQRYLEESKIDNAIGDSSRSSPQPDYKEKKKPGKDAKCDNLNSKPISGRDNSDSDYDDSDELPYCCMCTEDASIRCRDCDLDLYCSKCFKECHQKMDITDHRTVPYRPPKGYR